MKDTFTIPFNTVYKTKTAYIISLLKLIIMSIILLYIYLFLSQNSSTARNFADLAARLIASSS